MTPGDERLLIVVTLLVPTALVVLLGSVRDPRAWLRWRLRRPTMRSPVDEFRRELAMWRESRPR